MRTAGNSSGEDRHFHSSDTLVQEHSNRRERKRELPSVHSRTMTGDELGRGRHERKQKRGKDPIDNLAPEKCFRKEWKMFTFLSSNGRVRGIKLTGSRDWEKDEQHVMTVERTKLKCQCKSISTFIPFALIYIKREQGEREIEKRKSCFRNFFFLYICQIFKSEKS